jgi:hypothetical protein
MGRYNMVNTLPWLLKISIIAFLLAAGRVEAKTLSLRKATCSPQKQMTK